MFYTLLHAVLPLLILQIYITGIVFIYTVRLVMNGWDEGAGKPGLNPSVVSVADLSKAVLPSFP